MDLSRPGLGLELADEAQALAAAAPGQRAAAAGANENFSVTTSGAVSNVAQAPIDTAVDIVPKVSGKFLVSFQAYIANGAGSTTGITPAVGHGPHGGVIAADTIGAAALPIAAGTNGLVTFQWIIFGLVVGTHYDIAAMARASQVGANVADCRLYVQELVG